jgi:hypothetical protein
MIITRGAGASTRDDDIGRIPVFTQFLDVEVWARERKGIPMPRSRGFPWSKAGDWQAAVVRGHPQAPFTGLSAEQGR